MLYVEYCLLFGQNIYAKHLLAIESIFYYCWQVLCANTQPPTPFQGLSRYTKIIYALGCVDVLCNGNNLLSGMVETAGNEDTTVLMVGEDQQLEAKS